MANEPVRPRSHSIYAPLFNPFEKSLLRGNELMEIWVITAVLVVFLAAIAAFDFWMLSTTPA